MIYENYDEYPLSEQPESLKELLTPTQLTKVQDAFISNRINMTAFQESLALFNTVAAQGGILGTIASVVSAVREGFGMLLTGANLIRDPANTIGAAVGVTPQDVTRIGEGLKDGAFIPGVSMFVGGAARRTWESWLNTVEKAQIGDVFNAGEYRTTTTSANAASAELRNRREYERLHGVSNYEALVTAQRAIDEQTAAAEETLPAGVDRTEPNAGRIEQVLDESYGDTDNASSGDSREDPATLESVYGQGGTIQNIRPSGEERSKMIQEAYNGDAPPSDTDTTGITAVDADSAPIDAVI
jgi:hypothetical protein